MPLDAFHAAYISHRARMGNNGRHFGEDPLEHDLHSARIGLLTVVQEAYAAKQQSALNAGD
jgi:hypothetical protein